MCGRRAGAAGGGGGWGWTGWRWRVCEVAGGGIVHTSPSETGPNATERGGGVAVQERFAMQTLGRGGHWKQRLLCGVECGCGCEPVGCKDGWKSGTGCTEAREGRGGRGGEGCGQALTPADDCVQRVAWRGSQQGASWLQLRFL